MTLTLHQHTNPTTHRMTWDGAEPWKTWWSETSPAKKPSGPVFKRSNSALHYFFQFFPLSLLLSIVTWTNIKLREAQQKRTTIHEMRAWFGMHILMGLSKMANYRNYWSTHPALRNTMISSTMPRNRFDTINTHLACNNPEDDPALITNKSHQHLYKRKHPLYPLQPVWDKVRQRCLRRYNALRELTIDEAMIKYRGFKANVKKFFMPLKPIRAGFKIYVLAESATGVVLNFIVHPWKKRPAKMTTIATKVAKHHLGRYHHIFTDKLYTSVALAKAFLAKKTYLTGAVKSNSRGLPRDFLNTAKNPQRDRARLMNKVPRGTFYSRQSGQMVVTAWKDSRVMLTLSTAHQGWRDPDVHTVTRKIPDEHTQRRVSKVIPAPPQACDYTKFMGGVDRGDQLRAYHTCSRKAQFWWKKILYFLMDIARVNAYLSYKKHHPNAPESDESDATPTSKRFSHSQFGISLGTELINGYAGTSTFPQSKASETVPIHNISGHSSGKMPGLYPKQCRWCLHHRGVTKAGRTKTTKSGCHVCMVNLCPGPCFIKFHEASRRRETSDSSTPETTTPAPRQPQKKQEQKEKEKKAEAEGEGEEAEGAEAEAEAEAEAGEIQTGEEIGEEKMKQEKQ